jgi:hypothetical protein
LIESVLLNGAHNLATETGVGRFVINKKNVLLLSDVNLRVLYSGKDADKLKNIARTEPTSTKVHSSTILVPPTFIFVTSNQKLQTHKFLEKKISHFASTSKPSFYPRFYESDVEITGPKRHLDEHVTAIKMRYLEMFIRKRPEIDERHFPSSGSFQRRHFVIGLHQRVLCLLEKYKNAKYHSPFLYMYAFTGLCKNMQLFPVGTLEQTTQLMDVYRLSGREKASHLGLVVSRDEPVGESTSSNISQPKQQEEEIKEEEEAENISWSQDATAASTERSSASCGSYHMSPVRNDYLSTPNSFDNESDSAAYDEAMLPHSLGHDSGTIDTAFEKKTGDERGAKEGGDGDTCRDTSRQTARVSVEDGDTDDEMAQLDVSNL